MEILAQTFHLTPVLLGGTARAPVSHRNLGDDFLGAFRRVVNVAPRGDVGANSFGDHRSDFQLLVEPRLPDSDAVSRHDCLCCLGRLVIQSHMTCPARGSRCRAGLVDPNRPQPGVYSYGLRFLLHMASLSSRAQNPGHASSGSRWPDRTNRPWRVRPSSVPNAATRRTSRWARPSWPWRGRKPPSSR